MAKLGFNYITDEAIEQLRKDRFVISKNSGVWQIYTDAVDFKEEELLSKDQDVTGIYVPDYIKYITEQRREQPFRYWLCDDYKGQKAYFYLLSDSVYVCTMKKEIVGYSTIDDLPTFEVKTLFDLVEDPGSIEDILRAKKPAFQMPLF